ncbi:MAG: isochorismatase family protein [Bryobacter sp.]|nr:isochorismatase family protein [Bryobacter sp.]
MNRRHALSLLAAPGFAASRHLKLRSRVELYRGSGEWRPIEIDEPFDPARAAIVICDMWDRHWCRGASERVNAMVPRMVEVLTAARRRGALIIHAPSDTMGFYADAPQRKAAQALPKSAPPAPREILAPALPIDDSGGGCDTGDRNFKAWSRQHAGIPVEPADLVTDRGEEVYNALTARGIQLLIVMGVHTNMCILNRSFAIKQMTKWGVRCVLVRDLTDAMYNPQDRPQVTHDQGTELVIEYIERHWCPSTTSRELLSALR